MAEEPSALTMAAWTALRGLVDGKAPSRAALNSALRVLGKWRSELVAAEIRERSGGKVMAGPFAGMVYPAQASEGGLAPRLLGVYEASLWPVIEGAAARGYRLVVDVGAAEGYYAVGLARLLPQARVLARDLNPAARALCAAMAAANGVADRVELGGLFTHADFDICTGAGGALVICDIEGAEDELLDPQAAPGLAHADILVEVHEGLKPGLLARLQDRFAPTHRVTRLDRRLAPDALPPFAQGWSDMDRLIALWEWRAAPTPWLWMECR